MQRAAIYARLPEKGEHDLGQCLNIIKEGKSSLTNVYVDFGQSGFDFERPEFRKLELCVRERLVDMVVIPSLMQFCRDISKALAKIREFKSHVKFSISQGICHYEAPFAVVILSI